MTAPDTMPASWPIRVAALCGALAVGLGAFGAHGLEGRLEQLGTADIYQTAVFYHLPHAVVLFVLALWVPFRRGPYLSFLVGIVVFSGSLYLLAVTNMRWLGAITPIGGVAFLVGWCWLVLAPKQSS